MGLNYGKRYCEKIIPSVVEGRSYHVICDDVNWGDGGGKREKVIYLKVERYGKIQRYTSHIMPEDLNAVMEAMSEIKEKVGIK
ncbi:hypothetical protein SDC9_118374 [bioreactor metagenome]|jgi:hypothetical protein|uniref:Uncharacterized protein n=1 Tax=bioreactor metagenome TaxID=1076179 RepID=A0A645C1A0_9ZZZZ